jgi:hypothetical protein
MVLYDSLAGALVAVAFLVAAATVGLGLAWLWRRARRG